MTPTETLLAFLLAIGLLTVTPGLDTALVLRTAVREGRSAALLAAVGIGLGCLAWGVAVALGLGALLAASTLAYTALKLCGAAYLAWMGLGLLFKPRHSLVDAPDHNRASKNGIAWLRRGCLTNLLNPKVGVFYVSFLPQFVPAGWPVAPTVMGLVAIHIAMGIAWLGTLVFGLGTLRPRLLRPAIVAALDRLTGLVFIGFGLRLALDRR